MRNRAHPEGSIAEAHLADECMTFCSRYIDGFATKHNRPSRNDDDDEARGANVLGLLAQLDRGIVK